jgi:hypothetical protein
VEGWVWLKGSQHSTTVPYSVPCSVRNASQVAGCQVNVLRLFDACRLPLASITHLVRSYVLVPESNSQVGSTLRVSFQVTDAAGRTQVSHALPICSLNVIAACLLRGCF